MRVRAEAVNLRAWGDGSKSGRARLSSRGPNC